MNCWPCSRPLALCRRSFRRFTRAAALPLALATAFSAAAQFRLAPVDESSLGLWEGTQPVLVYRHGTQLKPGVPADRARSGYVHPLYGLDGEVLTDDFPKDHYHHRGLFWAWPHVEIAGQEYSTWDLRGVDQRFVTWRERQTRPDLAVLSVENGWFLQQTQVVREVVSLRVHPATATGRAIDVELTWTPLDRPIRLVGAPGKSYGGFTLRFAPRTNTVITTPLGQGAEDLAITRLPWADLSATFSGAAQPSGASIFIAPNHPDYPPTWLTRHYGVLCVGWPGVEAKTFPAGQAFTCRYRVWIHRGAPAAEALREAYEGYRTATGP